MLDQEVKVRIDISSHNQFQIPNERATLQDISIWCVDLCLPEMLDEKKNNNNKWNQSQFYRCVLFAQFQLCMLSCMRLLAIDVINNSKQLKTTYQLNHHTLSHTLSFVCDNIEPNKLFIGHNICCAVCVCVYNT